MAVIIFPTHLFDKHPCLEKDSHVFLVEDKRYFTDFNFHKKKLILHRASMRAYKDKLSGKGYKVTYVPFSKDWRALTKGHKLNAVQPYDSRLNLPEGINLSKSPGFLGGELKKSKRYIMGNFYKKQRARLGILMDKGEPVQGKWSLDEENRKPLPKGHQVPRIKAYPSKYIDEAQEYVEKHFPDNPGTAEGFIYPVTSDDARKWLKDFVRDRLELFGDYEDAISKDEAFIYHSLLSPLLNIGLLTPDEVLDEALNTNVRLNSIEGFVRQIIGWREFILQVYLLEGENQRSSNYFSHRRKIPKSFYNATTGTDPVDNVIYKVLKNAYSHHIERLMVLSNFMLLSGYHPDGIYRWFMEMYIDAYDWVMVPNVYGMGQYADGGLMSTKPYISSSKYILRMSDFSKGSWCDEWDGLFWNFLRKHRDKFSKNPRMALMMKQLDRH